MFSDKLNDAVRYADRIGRETPLALPEFRALLEKCTAGQILEPEEIVALLNSTVKTSNQELVLEMAVQDRRPHDQEILLLPPLYLSSVCENQCLYCDFSSEGTRLSLAEFAEEFAALIGLGYRSIELVSSQDPEIYLKSPEYQDENQVFDLKDVLPYFEESSQRLKTAGGGMLTSNIPPVDRKNFQKLHTAGLDCYLIWLETFNPDQYGKLHGHHGPKNSQDFRLNSVEQAIDAGLEHVAGAFLKGLYDWRKEEVILYLFDSYLKTKRGRGFSIIGTPRLKGKFTRSPLVKPYSISDKEYTLNIALDRLLFDGILWLQTRESFALNLELIEHFGGGTILTLTSCTAPGGYSKPPDSKAQFPVYKQDLEQSVARLQDRGLNVRFDWTPDVLAAFLRNTSHAHVRP
jgi:2-iminoacetate synthase